jgi:CarD family transcriptional regulator
MRRRDLTLRPLPRPPTWRPERHPVRQSGAPILGFDGPGSGDFMEFKVGDKAVYPGHGVGIIKRVETRDLEGLRQTFYVLEVLENPAIITIPVQNAAAIGMRQVISMEQVDKVYEILKDRDVPTDNQTWNRRYREYMNKIQTGDPIEVGKVLRDLALLKNEKNLSFGERKMFDQARRLLVEEISVAKDTDEKSIESEIDLIFAV